jgi:hypothetical protein
MCVPRERLFTERLVSRIVSREWEKLPSCGERLVPFPSPGSVPIKYSAVVISLKSAKQKKEGRKKENTKNFLFIRPAILDMYKGKGSRLLKH